MEGMDTLDVSLCGELSYLCHQMPDEKNHSMRRHGRNRSLGLRASPPHICGNRNEGRGGRGGRCITRTGLSSFGQAPIPKAP